MKTFLLALISGLLAGAGVTGLVTLEQEHQHNTVTVTHVDPRDVTGEQSAWAHVVYGFTKFTESTTAWGRDGYPLYTCGGVTLYDGWDRICVTGGLADVVRHQMTDAYISVRWGHNNALVVQDIPPATVTLALANLSTSTDNALVISTDWDPQTIHGGGVVDLGSTENERVFRTAVSDVKEGVTARPTYLRCNGGKCTEYESHQAWADENARLVGAVVVAQ